MKVCTACGQSNPTEARFCNACGALLATGVQPVAVVGSERKQVTVLFSDLSGFTSLSERLDPEETREIMARVFGQATAIVNRYGGQVEKYIGDAIMAIFGVPIANEDDPLRAARAAIDMHAMVAALAPEVRGRSGVDIALHSGINTGLVVTGELKFAHGSAGPLGDTINLAARLMALATDGEILLGPQSAKLIGRHFLMEPQGLRTLKGKTEPVSVARLIGVAVSGSADHQHKAALIGRVEELETLLSGAESARLGQVHAIAMVGEAGCGKSRLVDEFRSRLGSEFQWLEGRCYPYTENTPYFPLVNLLSRHFQIDDSDSHQAMRSKIAAGLAHLGSASGEIVPSIVRLYGIEGSDDQVIDREAFQGVLTKAMLRFFHSLSARRPTVICMQDIHWADGSTVSLLQSISQKLEGSLLLLMNHRPDFLPLPGAQVLQLAELSALQTKEMLRSLLGGEPPPALEKFVEARAEGNPFFIEEVVLTLIESRELTEEPEGWRFSSSFDSASVPSNIHGVIAARIDRLEESRRRLLRHASVVGREFSYPVVRMVQETIEKPTTEALKGNLNGLESAGMIRRLKMDAELTYSFKHALTQEVAYNGLLKSELSVVHQRTAQAIEEVFAERLSEFVEVLAHHYVRAGVVEKAVQYLCASARKSIECYAVDDAAQYYRQAYDLLLNHSRSAWRDRALIELLVEWSLVFYYQGDCRRWRPLMEQHLSLAEGLEEPSILGMYLGWSGHMLYWHEQYEASLVQLDRAAALGEQSNSERVTAYAQTWRAWTLCALGRTTEAIHASEAAIALGPKFPFEPYVVFKPQAAIAMAAAVSGDLPRVKLAAAELQITAERTGNTRAMVLAHCATAMEHVVNMDFDLAAEAGQCALRVASDPGYKHFAGVFIGLGLSGAHRYAELQALVKTMRPDVERLSQQVIGTSFEIMEGAAAMSLGEPTRGVEMMLRVERQASCPWIKVFAQLYLGTAYSLIARGEAKAPFRVLLRNPGFVVKHGIPAKRHAVRYLTSITENSSPGFKGYADDALVELAKLYLKLGKPNEALRSIEKAIAILEHQGATSGLQKAQLLHTSLRAVK